MSKIRKNEKIIGIESNLIFNLEIKNRYKIVRGMEMSD